MMKSKQNLMISSIQPFLFVILQLFVYVFFVDSAFSLELETLPINPIYSSDSKLTKLNQLPHSRVVKGKKNISNAWFGGATERYKHGILGDTLEASQLFVETTQGKQLALTLPDNRVFEDLEPRLVDINQDGKDEIMVVESDINLGASLALYALIDNQLKIIASTPFLGSPNRWLNPVGTGDFDGDGRLDVALVETPHIGGVLKLYRFSDSGFQLFAKYSGVSTHSIGSMDLGLGCVVDFYPKDLLILPNQSHDVLFLLEWTREGIKNIARKKLDGKLGSSLIPVKKHHWRYRLVNGENYELNFKE